MKNRTKYRKTIGLLLAFSLLISALSACGPAPAVTPTDAPTATPSESGSGTFGIRYELGDTADNFTLKPSEAKTGDTVEIRTGVLYDADIHVYVDGQEIRKSHYDSDYWGYSFVMPDKEVLVTAKYYTKGEVWGVSDEPVIWAEKMSFRKTEIITDAMSWDSFDEKLLAFLSEHTDGNYMASPLSFRYALGLLLTGAAGETKAELLKALGVKSEEEWIEYCLDFNGFVEFFASDLEEEIAGFKEMLKQGWIPAESAEPFRALRVANSVWKAERITESFKDAYKESVEKNYAAEYRSFTAANAVEKINEWADIKTEHMIPALLPEGYPTDELAIVLMNALYFKDAWQTEFAKALTEEGDFHAGNGQTTRKEFMTVTDYFSYYEDADTRLVILPMKGGVSMAFVIGSTEGLAEKIARAASENVKVTIPKMDLETDFSNGELVDFLKECGVSLAFDGRADFSAMIDYPVFVSDIIQKTRIKLDEEGVEAAAVTAIMMDECAAFEPEDPKVFTADEPFSFYIYTTCNDTTAVMFAGEIVE
jgi:serpin B